MRGDIIYTILNIVGDTVLSTVDFWEAVLRAGYGASSGKIDREYKAIERERETRSRKSEERRRLQIYLSKLKKDGLIQESPLGQVKLSTQGKKKLLLFRKKRIINKNSYKKEESGVMIIVSYDIPTPYNRERNILRDILQQLGFNMAHKSVWIGKVKLPKEFIFALGQMGITDYVEIFEVTKTGSLKSIKA